MSSILMITYFAGSSQSSYRFQRLFWELWRALFYCPLSVKPTPVYSRPGQNTHVLTSQGLFVG